MSERCPMVATILLVASTAVCRAAACRGTRRPRRSVQPVRRTLRGLYVGTIEASQHQLVPSDTVLLGHTSPESSISPPASRLMTHITDPDSKMESGVAPSVPPASSMLPLPAAAQDAHASLAQTSATLSSMSLTFVCPSTPIACIDDPPYMDPYAPKLPYGEDTPMDDE
jgi:hypothetical protein